MRTPPSPATCGHSVFPTGRNRRARERKVLGTKSTRWCPKGTFLVLPRASRGVVGFARGGRRGRRLGRRGVFGPRDQGSSCCAYFTQASSWRASAIQSSWVFDTTLPIIHTMPHRMPPTTKAIQLMAKPPAPRRMASLSANLSMPSQPPICRTAARSPTPGTRWWPAA